MKIREIIGEALCAVAIFAAGYGLLLVGHGMGW
jgi:hypothetical protein